MPALGTRASYAAFLAQENKLKDYEKNYDIKMDEEHMIGGGAFG